jgi:hypothetical protein
LLKNVCTHLRGCCVLIYGQLVRAEYQMHVYGKSEIHS